MGSWCSYFMLRDQNISPKLSQSTVTDRFYVEFKAQRPYRYNDDLSRPTATLSKTDLAPTFSVTAQIQTTASDSLVELCQAPVRLQ